MSTTDTPYWPSSNTIERPAKNSGRRMTMATSARSATDHHVARASREGVSVEVATGANARAGGGPKNGRRRPHFVGSGWDEHAPKVPEVGAARCYRRSGGWRGARSGAGRGR